MPSILIMALQFYALSFNKKSWGTERHIGKITMGKIKFLFLLGLLSVMTFSFSACSNDDGKIGSESDLIGTWESVSFYYLSKEDGEIVDEGRETDNSQRIKFNADGTCEVSENNNGQWNKRGQGTWVYKKGELTIKDGSGETESGNVKELTSSKLVVESIDKYTDDGVDCEDIGEIEYRKISK